MSFMMRKKRFQFNASVEVEELSSVPFINAVLFAKLRLVNGGTYTKFTDRVEVVDHRVRWKSSAKILCKMSASSTTGLLEPCVFRVSIRKELKGGHSYQKLGYVDINLSEYAGAGLTTRRYLLEGYDSKKRLDNSTLKVNIEMTLVSGDPVFQAPRPADMDSVLLQDEGYEGSGGCMGQLDEENKGASSDCSTDSLPSDNSAFGSLTRKDKQSQQKNPSPLVTVRHASQSSRESETFETSQVLCVQRAPLVHSGRPPQQCKSDSGAVGVHGGGLEVGSGAGGLVIKHSHVRQLSDSAVLLHSTRNSNRVVLDPTGSMTRNPKKSDCHLSHERRVDSTRVDADELVDELFKGTDFRIDDSNQHAGLQLVVRKDGTATFG